MNDVSKMFSQNRDSGDETTRTPPRAHVVPPEKSRTALRAEDRTMKDSPTPEALLELQRRAVLTDAPGNGEKIAANAPGWKENNPKDAFGVLKGSITSYCYLPVLMEMAVGMAEGGFKYGAHNYLVAAPRSSVYTDAALRHIFAFVGGEDLDPDSGVGLHHIAKAMTSLHVLRAAIINEHWIDDRPPAAPKGWLDSLNTKMEALAKKFPEPVARYLANGKRGPGKIL